MGNNDWDMSWGRTGSDIKLVQMDSGNKVEAVRLDLEDSNYWKSHQRFEDVGNESTKCRGETLYLFRNFISLSKLDEFLVNNPCIDEGDENKLLGGSIFRLARSVALFAIAVTCTTEKSRRGSHRLKLYADTNGTLLPLAMEQLTGNMLLFVEYWVGEIFVSCPQVNVLKPIRMPSRRKAYLAFYSAPLQQIVPESLGVLLHCYVSKLNFECEVVPLGQSNIQLNVGDFDDKMVL